MDAKDTEAPDNLEADKDKTGQNLQNGNNRTPLSKEESDAAKKAKDEKRAEAQRAARARVETLDAVKKQKVGEAAAIKIDDE